MLATSPEDLGPDPVSLEVTVRPSPDGNADALAGDVEELLRTIDELDRELGGTGFTKLSEQPSEGGVTLLLAPADPKDAGARIWYFHDIFNEPPKPKYLTLPPVAHRLAARPVF